MDTVFVVKYINDRSFIGVASSEKEAKAMITRIANYKGIKEKQMEYWELSINEEYFE